MYKYTVKFYDEDGNLHIECGFTHGHAFAEAMENVVRYFGEDQLEDVTLTFITDNDVLSCPEEYLDTIKEANQY